MKSPHRKRPDSLLLLAMSLVVVVASSCSPDRAPDSGAATVESGAPESVASADPTLRELAQGQISGTLRDNGSYAWRGIPYAEPPVGERRWQPPRPASAWSGVLEARQRIEPCVQFASGLTEGVSDEDGDGIVGSEDCLYLSVYAPAGSSPGDSLPVMYWIFGGGNNSGYAGDYDGSALAQSQDVVVVTVNYRLGSLGWFLHPAILAADASGEDASGNWSTLDTILGLRWVRENIAEFGGDPDTVTIFGESAGGSNVMSLLTSPLADGLFHRAVVQSGGVGTTSLAQGMNYMDDEVPGHFHSSREIINKILVRDGSAADRDAAKALQQDMSAGEIRELLYDQDAGEFLRLYNPEASRNYPAPKKFTDGTVFVEQPPLEQLASGDYNRVPIILGTNLHERRIYVYRALEDVVRNDPAEYERLTKYPSDLRKFTGVDRLARRMSAVQEDVYAFRFDWDEWRTTEDGFDLALAIGAAHSTEMAFVFGDWRIGFVNSDAYDPDTNPGRDRLAEAMMSYWANFAYTGSPGRGREGELPEWERWENGAGEPKMMILDSENDGGIRMSDEEVTLESIKAEFMRETFSSEENRCRTYREAFGGTAAFDREEYVSLSAAGC